MVCYLSISIFIKLFFIISNVLILYALYLADLSLFFKLLTAVLAFWINFKAFLEHQFIKGFYLSLFQNKSILLTKDHQEIKVNFLEVSYFNHGMIVLYFTNKLRVFRVVIFKDSIPVEQFQTLQILAKYKILNEKCESNVTSA